MKRIVADDLWGHKMKIALFLTVVFAGLMFVSFASAHPGLLIDECRMVLRDKTTKVFDLRTAEEIDYVSPLNNPGPHNQGHSVIICRADFGPGASAILNNANTGEICDLGFEASLITSTKEWEEDIKANGEATLICVFPPH